MELQLFTQLNPFGEINTSSVPCMWALEKASSFSQYLQSISHIKQMQEGIQMLLSTAVALPI